MAKNKKKKNNRRKRAAAVAPPARPVEIIKVTLDPAVLLALLRRLRPELQHSDRNYVLTDVTTDHIMGHPSLLCYVRSDPVVGHAQTSVVEKAAEPKKEKKSG